MTNSLRADKAARNEFVLCSIGIRAGLSNSESLCQYAGFQTTKSARVLSTVACNSACSACGMPNLSGVSCRSPREMPAARRQCSADIGESLPRVIPDDFRSVDSQVHAVPLILALPQ